MSRRVFYWTFAVLLPPCCTARKVQRGVENPGAGCVSDAVHLPELGKRRGWAFNRSCLGLQAPQTAPLSWKGSLAKLAHGYALLLVCGVHGLLQLSIAMRCKCSTAGCHVGTAGSATSLLRNGQFVAFFFQADPKPQTEAGELIFGFLSCIGFRGGLKESRL